MSGMAHSEDAHVILLPLKEQQVRAAAIETQPVEAESGGGELVVSGVVVAPPQQLRIVASPVAGMIEAFLVAPDEDVKEGEPIARLRSPEQVESQRAFLHARSEYALNSEKLRRDEQLFRERIIPERRLIVTRAEAAQARANLEEREQLLALQGMSAADIDVLRAESKLASVLIVRAPLSGVILARQGSAGERIAASAPLVTIARLDPLWINLQIPIGRVPALENVEHVTVPSAGVEGKLIRIGRSVDSGTQSVTAVLELRPGKAKLRPGQVVQAILQLRGGGVHWRVPAEAIVSHHDQNFVFVLYKRRLSRNTSNRGVADSAIR